MIDKRQKVIEEAFKLIYQKGYHGTGINEIVKAAGVPKGSFYYYFKTKENLVIETIHYYRDSYMADVQPLLTNKDIPPMKRLALLNDHLLDTYENVWHYTHGCYAGNLALEMGDINEPLRQTLDQYFEENCQLFAQCLREAQEMGELRSDLDADELAAFIVTSYEGALIRMKTSKSIKPLQNYMKMMDEILKQ